MKLDLICLEASRIIRTGSFTGSLYHLGTQCVGHKTNSKVPGHVSFPSPAPGRSGKVLLAILTMHCLFVHHGMCRKWRANYLRLSDIIYGCQTFRQSISQSGGKIGRIRDRVDLLFFVLELKKKSGSE